MRQQDWKHLHVYVKLDITHKQIPLVLNVIENVNLAKTKLLVVQIVLKIENLQHRVLAIQDTSMILKFAEFAMIDVQLVRIQLRIV